MHDTALARKSRNSNVYKFSTDCSYQPRTSRRLRPSHFCWLYRRWRSDWSYMYSKVKLQQTGRHTVKGPCKGGYPSPPSEFQSLLQYVAISEGSRVAVGISTWRHYVYADRVRKNTLPDFNLIRQGLRSTFLSEGALSWPALSILNLGGSGGMLPRENLSSWTAENSVRSLYVFACHCYANERTTDGNVSSRAEWVSLSKRVKIQNSLSVHLL